MVKRIGENSDSSGTLPADDLRGYDATLDADNVADAISGCMVKIAQKSAGLLPQIALKKQKQQQLSADLKIRYGDYLLEETEGYCPFPGCGKQLTVRNKGKAVHAYEVSLADKSEPATPDNLIAVCPQCHATYLLGSNEENEPVRHMFSADTYRELMGTGLRENPGRIAAERRQLSAA